MAFISALFSFIDMNPWDANGLKVSGVLDVILLEEWSLAVTKALTFLLSFSKAPRSEVSVPIVYNMHKQVQISMLYL